MARYGEELSRERWRDDDRERSGNWRDRDDNRGFFERAGDEVRSWFSDDDHRDRDRGSNRSNWDRDSDFSRSGTPRSSSMDRDLSRSTFSNHSGRRSSWDNEDRSFFGGMSQGGSGNWDRDQGRGSFGRSNESSYRDRFGSSKRDFGGFRDESDFRGQHRRDHAQSWGEANRGQNESLGYGEYSGALGGFGNQTVGISKHDHYRNWRDREMAKLDKDYGDYCREREQQFNQDFDSWRSNRSSRSPSASNSASGDFGSASNAGVGTTTASMTGSAGAGSALGSATGTGGSIQSDTTAASSDSTSSSGRSRSRT